MKKITLLIFIIFCLLLNYKVAKTQTYINVFINQLASPATPVITQNGNILTSSSLTGNQWFRMYQGIEEMFDTTQSITMTANGDYYLVVNNGICWANSINSISYYTGIKEYSGDNFLINVFPNPANDIVTIDFKNVVNRRIKIEIFKTIGQTIFNKEIVCDDYQLSESIDISIFNKGIYLFKFVVGETQKTWVRYIFWGALYIKQIIFVI